MWKHEKDRLTVNRLLILSGFFLVLSWIYFGRLFYLQILQGDKYLLMAEKNRLSIRLTMPDRGKIFDRNGKILADNHRTFRAVLVKEESKDYQLILDRFSTLIPLEPEEREQVEKEIKRKRAFMPVVVKENLTVEQVALLNLNAPDLPGVQIEQGMIRHYPFQNTYAHLVGYVSRLLDSDMTDKNDALSDIPGYRIGRSGIEKTQNKLLSGIPGQKKSEVNAAGRTVRLLEKTKSISGEDITLTIDSKLQKFALKALDNQAGSVILMDVETGEIRAMVSSPTFDPNIFLAPISVKNWDKIIKNKMHPLQDKAVSATYSPGSIFKLIVALAGLENGTLKQKTTIPCEGVTQLGEQLFHCWKKDGHGPLDLVDALAASCDVYFYEAAQRIGAEQILSVARTLGFGEKTGIEIADEKSGLVPSAEWKKEKYNDSWRMGDTLNLSIGQGFLNVSPLQIVRAVAAIANGGYLVQPHVISTTQQTKQVLNFKKKNLDIVKAGMYEVVNRPGATGYASRFNLYGMTMSGKTATTQVRRITMEQREKGWSEDDIPWEYKDHALFAAFGPSQKPRYAIVVVVEHGGGGSRVAAPIASQVLREALRLDSLAK